MMVMIDIDTLLDYHGGCVSLSLMASGNWWTFVIIELPTNWEPSTSLPPCVLPLLSLIFWSEDDMLHTSLLPIRKILGTVQRYISQSIPGCPGSAVDWDPGVSSSAVSELWQKIETMPCIRGELYFPNEAPVMEVWPLLRTIKIEYSVISIHWQSSTETPWRRAQLQLADFLGPYTKSISHDPWDPCRNLFATLGLASSEVFLKEGTRLSSDLRFNGLGLQVETPPLYSATRPRSLWRCDEATKPSIQVSGNALASVEASHAGFADSNPPCCNM